MDQFKNEYPKHQKDSKRSDKALVKQLPSAASIWRNKHFFIDPQKFVVIDIDDAHINSKKRNNSDRAHESCDSPYHSTNHTDHLSKPMNHILDFFKEVLTRVHVQ